MSLEAQSRVYQADAKAYDSAADRAYVEGRPFLSSSHGQSAAASFKRAAEVDRVRGDYVGAHRNELDASITMSKASSRSPPASPVYVSPLVVSAARYVFLRRCLFRIRTAVGPVVNTSPLFFLPLRRTASTFPGALPPTR